MLLLCLKIFVTLYIFQAVRRRRCAFTYDTYVALILT